jgi:hypothetical protein
VPRTERGYHPLCAAYTRVSRPGGLADGRLKMIDLLQDVRLRAVMTNEIDAFGDHRRLLASVNTPVVRKTRRHSGTPTVIVSEATSDILGGPEGLHYI